jgi:hypothetical protein
MQPLVAPRRMEMTFSPKLSALRQDDNRCSRCLQLLERRQETEMVLFGVPW